MHLHAHAVIGVHHGLGTRVSKKPDPQAGFRAWVKASLNRTTKSAKGLAKVLGIHPAGVTSMIKPYGRKAQVDEVPKIVAYIGKEPPAGILPGIEEPFELQGARAVTPTRKVPIVAVIAPDMWRDGEAEIRPMGTVAVMEDDRLEGFDQYACWIDRPRSYAICVPYFEMRTKPVADDIVHVRRKNAAGQVEDSIRKVTIAKGKVQLVIHLAPVKTANKALAYPSNKTSEEIEITGLVVGIHHKTF